MLLSYCMAMRTVSFRVKKRFPDLQHLVDAGLMREDELKVSHLNSHPVSHFLLSLRHFRPTASVTSCSCVCRFFAFRLSLPVLPSVGHFLYVLDVGANVISGLLSVTS